MVKRCPHFSEVNTEAESLCSDESRAVNAVNQMRMEKMFLVRFEDFQDFAK